MRARRWLPLAALAVACGGGGHGPPATTTTSTTTPLAAPGVHDHTPHHGGVVGMAGTVHLEARLAPEGGFRLWVTDVWRRPIAPTRVAGSATLELASGDRRLDLVPGADALEARGPAIDAPEVPVAVAVTVDGKAIDMDFLLPTSATHPGAAGVPTGACTPPADAGPDGPRCALAFARPITAIAVSQATGSALVGGVDLGTTVWRLPSGTLALGLAPPPPLVVPGPEGARVHPEVPAAYAPSPDGREVVVALEHRLLRYAVASGRLVAELASPGAFVRAVAWSPDGAQLLVSCFYEGDARLVRAADGGLVRRLPAGREAAAVAFAPDGRTAAVGADDGGVTLFALDREAAPVPLPAGRGPVQALVFVGGRLVAAGDDGVLRLLDPGATQAPVEVAVGTPVARLAPGPGVVASAGVDGAIRLHDLRDGAVRATLRWHRSQILGLAWLGDTIVSDDLDGRVAIWDVSLARPRGGSGSAP